ncbi:Crp/Fnr family transcriptional regulator [Microvirga sp. W0021]|uniref:Crp/Fnr family transcriptional regulator n=1 Tax=Hohaiivirga grylli TaxID=3133970 RepID=A0ABV0BLX1_9HYPH
MMRLADFALLKDAGIDFATVESRCRWKKFDPNEILMDFDDPSTDVYFLISGDVRILMRTAAGKEVILNEMRGGELFGELAAVDGVKRSANVTALTRGEVCIMPAAVFREVVYNTPIVAERMFRILTNRIRELNARIVEHTVLDLRHRLYAELLRMSVQRHGHEGQRVVTPPPYHHVLAGRIGCRREQVTREFSTMTQEGLIERTRGALVLMKPEVMQTRVSEALREDG